MGMELENFKSTQMQYRRNTHKNLSIEACHSLIKFNGCNNQSYTICKVSIAAIFSLFVLFFSSYSERKYT